MPHCDIVIPTFNTPPHVFNATLTALWQQVVPSGWTLRVIVSDDGSNDETIQYLQQVRPVTGWQYQLVTNAHGGSAHARNQGIKQASGFLVLLLGADIILRPGALAAHLDWHLSQPALKSGALGFIKWDPRLPPSRLMTWMMHGGQQNNYDAILGEAQADPRHYFYGSHISIKTALLQEHLFSTAFKKYGWEDFELGRRLANVGFTLAVLPQAVGLHHHFYSVADICRRQFASGQSLLIYQQLHPNVQLIPSSTTRKKLKHRIGEFFKIPFVLQGLVSMMSKYWTLPWLFKQLTGAYFWLGVHKKSHN